MARGTRYSQEFKEDAVRYRLEHHEIALRKYNSMLTLIVHFYFPFCQMQEFHPTYHKISVCLLLFSTLLFNIFHVRILFSFLS